MKIKWSAASLVAATGLAYGQSSVALYGIADTRVSYYSNA
jgi:predicted porin